MEDLLNLILVNGNLLETLVRLFIVVLSFDCVIGFATMLSTISDSLK